MRELPFTTFQEVTRRSRGRKRVLFGAGPISAKTRRRLSEGYAFIADNNSSLWGSVEDGLEVCNPEAIRQASPGTFYILICTTSFGEVAEQLESFGLEAGNDFVVSPILNDLRVIYELEAVERRLLFTSGAPPSEDAEVGGGLYELVVDGVHHSHRKILSGTCYGLARIPSGYVLVDHTRGLTRLNEAFEIRQVAPLPDACSPHGVAFSEVTGCYYVVASYLDAVLVYDENLSHVESIPLSNKHALQGTAEHHCNDVCAVDHSLFVTMFSMTGNWKREVFDGGILEIEIPANRKVGPVTSGLWMPHNVCFIEGSLTVLDSLRGELLRHNLLPQGRFNGFTRGIAHDGVYFYIGQSRNRNFSRALGVSNNIAIDTAIVIFDEQTKVSRSLQLPQRLSEVHSIVVVQ